MTKTVLLYISMNVFNPFYEVMKYPFHTLLEPKNCKSNILSIRFLTSTLSNYQDLTASLINKLCHANILLNRFGMDILLAKIGRNFMTVVCIMWVTFSRFMSIPIGIFITLSQHDTFNTTTRRLMSIPYM